MMALRIYLLLLIPICGFAQWSFINIDKKTDYFESHVLIRQVSLGKSKSLAALIQNTRLGKEFYPQFSKVQEDDVAQYLLKSFSTKYSKEVVGHTSLYRTQTETDHIRLMVKKRKKDFLISFAFVKRPFLFKGYNETDFFQRLFIANENKKSSETKTSWFQYYRLFVQKGNAQGNVFSMNTDSLLGAVGKVSSTYGVNSNSNLMYASQSINSDLGPNAVSAVNNVAYSTQSLGNNVAYSSDRVAGSIDNLANQTGGAGRSFERSSQNFGQSVQSLNNVITDPKTWATAGVGLAVGSMFSNLVVSGINASFKAMKNALLDLMNIYKDGEKEQILKKSEAAWTEYEGIAGQLQSREKEIQDIEIALQLASGKSIEEIYNINGQSLGGVAGNGLNDLSRGSCRDAHDIIYPGELNKLKALSKNIQNNPEVKKQLCERLNRNMDYIESLSDELDIVRTRISHTMMQTFNDLYATKQESLMGPQVIEKQIKDCKANSKADIEADETRFSDWKCKKILKNDDKKISDEKEKCLSLKSFIDDTKKNMDSCEKLGQTILTRDNQQYINTRQALQNSKKRMDEAQKSFLQADCNTDVKMDYCNSSDGSIIAVKKSYNANLAKLKTDQCPDLKTARFGLSKAALAGDLPSEQSTIEHPIIASDASSVSTDPQKKNGNFFTDMWASFFENIKSLFSWFSS